MSRQTTMPGLPAGQNRNRRAPLAGFALALALPLFSNCRAANPETVEIKAVLEAQVDAWNRGDIDAFMEHYWKSDELTFASIGRESDPETGETTRTTKTIKGWSPTLERYKKRYPTRERMGMLEFRELEIARTADTEAAVSGRFRLVRESDDNAGGTFYLNMRRIDGAWVIVKDRTMSD